MTLVYGVGINDANYRVSHKKPGEKEWRCPIYKTWKNMLARCYSPAYLKQAPDREGSHVYEGWLTFSVFKRWMESQDWEGKVIDKDVLVVGNRDYGPDTCIFVSSQVNSFFSERITESGHRGVYRNGNGWRSVTKDFFKGKQVHGVTFRTIQEAVNDHAVRHHKSALQLADLQNDPRIINILRTRFTPKS